MADDFRMEVDPRNLRAIVQAAKQFDAALGRNLRRQLRQAGQGAITDMRGVLGGGAIGGGIGRGIRLEVQTSKARQGVRIRATGSGLPGDKRPLVKAFNAPSFRHPVYGMPVWVDQPGRPYFGSVIVKHRDQIRESVETALGDALKEISR
jgi:hypothetical protein